MVENRGFDILDYLVLLVKWKRVLILTCILALGLSYLSIYFFVAEEFESTAVVVPSGDSQLGGLSGIMKNLKDLPLGLGGKAKSADTDLYFTIIYSRTSLENLIKKFSLMQDYKAKLMDEAVKELRKKITAEVADDNSVHISVKASSAQKAADMVNYILSYLNESVIKLNIAKSKSNREFLEKRYSEIKRDLRFAEDSLQIYQQKSGILDAKEQPKLILSSISKLEGEVLAKQIEVSIMEKISAGDSPQLQLLKTQLQEYQREFQRMKNEQNSESLIQPLNVLPEKTKNYVRYFRNVEIYNAILEFLVPLYEQAKFEEQKDMPVLQIIDYGNVPQKRVYPQRVLMSLIITFIVFCFAVAFIIIKEKLKKSTNPRINFITQELKLTNKKDSNLIGS